MLRGSNEVAIAPRRRAPDKARREAQNPDTDHAEQITEEVRTRIAPEDRVLDETGNRRDKVRKAVERFKGVLKSFASGSTTGDTSAATGAG